MAKEYEEDGVSWRDGSVFCYTEEYLNTFSERRQKYLRKWNCVEPDNKAEGFAIFGSKFVDVFFNEVATYLVPGDDWGDGKLLMSHIEDDGHYETPPNFVQDTKDWWYKVLHAGMSLVFSAPLMGVMSLINRELMDAELDPGLVNHMSITNVPDVVVNFLRDMFSDWYVVGSTTFDPISNDHTMNLSATVWDPIPDSGVMMTNLGVVTFDPISVS